MRNVVNDKEEATFQMAPMIDMVFLLLVFFMCASQLSSQNRQIQLTIPDAAKAVIPKERPDRWTLNIDLDGNIYEGTQLLGNDEAALKALEAAVKQKIQENPKLKIYLRADKESPHKNVKRVISAMAAVGVADFIFGVFIPPESKAGSAAAASVQ
jgi:biopolymer transport protein ExbD